jgi:tRNA pseudouridine55 synthase
MKFCGVLNLDKPIGLTSRDVVNRVVRLVRPAKVGHAGTLDPLATGVLVVCVGHATRLISLAQEGRKRYLARFVLGQSSDTVDITGQVTQGGDWTGVKLGDLEGLLPQFVGRIQQVPPQFSAIHVQGERAYDLARRGEVVELQARPVDVFAIRIVSFEAPVLELDIECGSGTYIRSLARDLGARLGCGALMTDLRRLGVGPFLSSAAIAADQLTLDNLAANLQPAINLVQHLPKRFLAHDEVLAVRRGQGISLGRLPGELLSGELTAGFLPATASPPAETRIALVGVDGELLGMGEADFQEQRLRPRIVFPD